MPFYLHVNGNRVHDEGERAADGAAARLGGGELSFATRAEAEAHADALHARTEAHFAQHHPRRKAPARTAYEVTEG